MCEASSHRPASKRAGGGALSAASDYPMSALSIHSHVSGKALRTRGALDAPLPEGVFWSASPLLPLEPCGPAAPMGPARPAAPWVPRRTPTDTPALNSSLIDAKRIASAPTQHQLQGNNQNSVWLTSQIVMLREIRRTFKMSFTENRCHSSGYNKPLLEIGLLCNCFLKATALWTHRVYL